MPGSSVRGRCSAQVVRAAGGRCPVRRRTRESRTRAISRAPVSERAAMAVRRVAGPSRPVASAWRRDRHSQVQAGSARASSARCSGRVSRRAAVNRVAWARRVRSYQMGPRTPRWSALESSVRRVSVADRMVPSRCRMSARTAISWRRGSVSPASGSGSGAGGGRRPACSQASRRARVSSGEFWCGAGAWLGVGVPGEAGDAVGVVSLRAPGHRDVQPLPVGESVDQDVAYLNGAAYGGVGGGRVGQIAV
jgi:hypothetical protein